MNADYKSIDKFDRMHGSLNGRADVTRCKPTTITVHTPLIGATQTYIIETMRSPDEHDGGDFIFVQYVDDLGATRIYLPPQVADAIARQRDALGTKNRKRAARERAQRDKAAGIQPAFLKAKKRKSKRAASTNS